VEPGRELRLAAELTQPDAELRERLLRGVAGVLGIGQEMVGKALDARSVALAKSGQRRVVALVTKIGSLSFS
jgi:hypothetical protein